MRLKQITQNKETIGLTILVLSAVGLFLRCADGVFLADTEIWAVNLTKELFRKTYEISVFYKPLFHLVISPTHFFDSSNASVLLSARWIFAFIGLGILFLTYQTAYFLTLSQRTSILAVLFLVTNTLFLSRGYRIRSDLLACFFHLASMLLILWGLQKPILRHKRYSLALGLLVTLMLLSTPKAVYYLAAQLVFVISLRFFGQNLKKESFFNWVLASHLAPVLLGIGVILISDYAAPILGTPSLVTSYLGAIHFFAEIPQSRMDTPSYLSSAAFSYVRILIFQNPVWFSLFYLSLLLALLGFIKKKRQKTHVWKVESSYYLYGFSIFLFMLLHNHRLPFFIAAMLPPLCILSALFSSNIIALMSMRLSSFLRTSVLSSSIVLVLASYLLFKGFQHHQELLRQNNNRQQLYVIRSFENYLKEHALPSFYDMVGSLPLSSDIYAFVGPGEADRFPLLKEKLNRANPDIVLFSSRLQLLEPFITERFLSQKVPIGHGLFVPGIHYSLKSKNKAAIKYPNGSFYRIPWQEAKLLLSFATPDAKVADKPVSVFHDHYAGSRPEQVKDLIWVEWESGAVTPWTPHFSSDQQEKFRALLVSSDLSEVQLAHYEPFEIDFDGLYMHLFRFDVDK